ncbi:hypothetical protein [Streptomyces mutabilis]|uniref:hypothetical protein n=1 Tax=Streptomyces mutabilis TaxID=67332 RepID=UPI000693CA6B|nr:hypothetical protein [Streptomyces mutabilis]
MHRSRCDFARCANTGLQRLACPHPGSACNTRWSGQWLRTAERREYGLLYRPNPASSELLPDLNRSYTECDWDPARQRMVLRSRMAAGVSR